MAGTPQSHSPLLTRASLATAQGWLHGFDPRARVVLAGVLGLVVALASQPQTLAIAAVGGVAAVGGAGVRLAAAAGRLVPINVIMLMLVLLLPWGSTGTPLVELGGWSYGRDGLAMALLMTLKANAIMLWMVALLSGMELTVVGHALAHLRVPEKLVHLLLMTVRYIDLLHAEYTRLRGAMKLRGFVPRTDVHTMRVYGFLVGMLLVRGTERAHRVLAAMKCRGFHGRFYLLDHFAWTRRDFGLSAAGSLFLLMLVWMDWWWGRT